MTDPAKFGNPVEGWTPPETPNQIAFLGRYARLERLNADQHAVDLHRANAADDRIWDYLPYGPFASAAEYRRWAEGSAAGDDPIFYAIRDEETGHFGGVASFLRIKPEAGSIEVGHINLSAEIQRTRAATEALYLMMKWVFQAGYRRFEWKCNALNLGSRRAAERLGFSYEGVFRQHLVVKGRNRDTAWFAMIDSEWPALQSAFETWLRPENFDAEGRQITRLSDLTRPIRITDDPALHPA
ncbi:GNAT family N-acetyltransferase [Aliiroseovarius sp. YM-037]|uniref:GNAT family N-acetyltransferase n=1 Tax=Aliiroseovarius sp. YM-037 TaxID=3341728 RepID=UPI003A7FDAF7